MFQSCRLYVGATMHLTDVARQLVAVGYERQTQTMGPGDFSVRGQLLDVFPGTFESPLRVILDGNRIEQIRSFNPATGELLETHAMVILLPRSIRLRVSEEMPLEPFVDIRPGDIVVHVDHGMGKYLGLETLTRRGKTQDHLVLEYAGGDKLYVPSDQTHLVQKYIGFEGRAPTLHMLGGQAWERAKRRAREGAAAYARELLELQAKRMALKGFAFSPDVEWQQAFQAQFPYRDTPDQRRATEDVKRDMEATRPMDRLLLGDVGYGKTEVAMRAAFKAVMSQRQVAVLVPTTILAYQHSRTLAKRLTGF